MSLYPNQGNEKYVSYPDFGLFFFSFLLFLLVKCSFPKAVKLTTLSWVWGDTFVLKYQCWLCWGLSWMCRLSFPQPWCGGTMSSISRLSLSTLPDAALKQDSFFNTGVFNQMEHWLCEQYEDKLTYLSILVCPCAPFYAFSCKLVPSCWSPIPSWK